MTSPVVRLDNDHWVPAFAGYVDAGSNLLTLSVGLESREVDGFPASGRMMKLDEEADCVVAVPSIDGLGDATK